MSEGRRLVVIVLLLVIGFGMLALADALEAWWPLFLTPFPYALIPWMIVNEGPRVGPGPVERP